MQPTPSLQHDPRREAGRQVRPLRLLGRPPLSADPRVERALGRRPVGHPGQDGYPQGRHGGLPTDPRGHPRAGPHRPHPQRHRPRVPAPLSGGTDRLPRRRP